MSEETEKKEKVRIIEDIKELKREEKIPDNEFIEEQELQEELTEELEFIEDDSVEEGSFAPLLEANELPQEGRRSFVLDDLKDVNTPSKKKQNKGKTEEMYSSKTAEDFYNNGATPNDFYKGISPDQGPMGVDFYEQSSMDSFYNNNSSGDQFYAMPFDSERESESDRLETTSNLEKKFKKEEKKDDLMFRS